MSLGKSSFLFIGSLVACSLLMTSASAAPSAPTGSIELEAPSAVSTASIWPTYGDTVAFVTSFEGRLSSKARLYVTLVCEQGGDVVYQWSGDVDFAFPLEDQGSQYLEWDGGAADCTAQLIYREQQGKKIKHYVLDEALFPVASAN